MKTKSYICALVCLVIIISITFPKAHFNRQSYEVSDIDGHWAEDYMTTLVLADIIRPEDEKANPQRQITRGEFTAIVSRALLTPGDYEADFGDVPSEHMFFEEISAAASCGIILGTGDKKFLPESLITREEMMLIFSRIVPEANEVRISFSDIDRRYLYYDELKKAVSSGIICGLPDGRFNPRGKASRAEASVMLVRLMEAYAETDSHKAESMGKEYVKNALNDPSKNLSVSLGRALLEGKERLYWRDEISSLGMDIKKTYEDIRLTEYFAKGLMCHAVYQTTIDYIITTPHGHRTKKYKSTHHVYMINSRGHLMVYDYTMSLGKNRKINLSWEVYSNPPDYAPRGVNVVSPSSFEITHQTSSAGKKLDEELWIKSTLNREYMNYARDNGFEVWPIYKTDFKTNTAHRFLESASARKNSIKTLMDYMKVYLFDGINIDFENVYKADRHLLSDHARELAIAMHEIGAVVSVDVTRKEPTSANWSMCYNRDTLSYNTDYIMLMAYDEYYASSKTAGPVASLDWVEDSVVLTLTEVDADKLVLGIPFYMRYFETEKGKVVHTKAIGMDTAYDLVNSNPVTYTYMDRDRQYKISWRKGARECVFWLENTKTLEERAKLASKYQLAGVATWRRGLEISKAWDAISVGLSL